MKGIPNLRATCSAQGLTEIASKIVGTDVCFVCVFFNLVRRSITSYPSLQILKVLWDIQKIRNLP